MDANSPTVHLRSRNKRHRVSNCEWTKKIFESQIHAKFKVAPDEMKISNIERMQYSRMMVIYLCQFLMSSCVINQCRQSGHTGRHPLDDQFQLNIAAACIATAPISGRHRLHAIFARTIFANLWYLQWKWWRTRNNEMILSHREPRTSCVAIVLMRHKNALSILN